MARSIFPQPAGPGGKPLPGASPGVPSPLPPSGHRRWPWTALVPGLAGAGLAVIFAGLWWRSESRIAGAEERREAVVTELARAAGDQTRQRRMMTQVRLSADEQLNLARQEAAELRRRLTEAERTAAEAKADLSLADRRGQELAAELAARTDATRQQETLLETERVKSGALERNLSLAESDLSSRAALHEQDMEELRTHVVSLRDEVTVRDIEVTNLISRAEREISGSQQEAARLQQQTAGLESRLSQANAENSRLSSQVSSLESDLYRERAENERLHKAVYKLECEIRDLRVQLAQALSLQTGGGAATAGAGAAP